MANDNNELQEQQGIQFEDIEPWFDGSGDTGLSARLKLKRNFDKLKAWIDSLRGTDFDSKYLSRQNDDEALGNIEFKKSISVDEGVTTDNIQSSNYTGEGMADTGYMLTGRDSTGSSKLVVDNLYVRKKATFEELEVKKETAVAGNEIRSCAANVILRTDYYDGDDHRMGYSVTTVPWMLRKVPFLLHGRFFGRLRKTRLMIEAGDISRIRRVRCYFLAKDGDTEVENLWQVYDSESLSTTGNDLARCQTMNLKNSNRKTYLQGLESKIGNVFWWRRLCGKSDDPVRLDDGKWYHYIDVEMNYDLEQSAVGNPPHCMKGSDIPAAGDHVVQFGNDLNPDRMNLIALEVNGADSPAIKGYKGIYTFDLNQCWWGGDPQKMVLSPATGYKFYGPEFYFQIENTQYRQPIERGEYQTNTRYYYYDRVSHAGSLWLCVVSDGAHWEDAQGNTIPTRTDGATRVRNWTVEEPGTGNAWVKQVAKGVDGTDGDDGYTPRKGVDYYDGDDSYSVVLMPQALIIEQSTTKQNGSYPLVLSNAKTVVKMYKAGTEISVTNITVTSRQGCSTSVSGTTVSITGINSTDVLTGYVDMAVTGDGVTIPARLAFAVNWLGSWKESVIGDTKTEVAGKLKFTWNGTTYDTLETIGTFIRSSRENVSKLEEITTTGQDGKRHVKQSEISQHVDGIGLVVKDDLSQAGINIDTKVIELRAGKTIFKAPTGDNTRIWIDGTDGSLHAVDGHFEGVVEASAMYSSVEDLIDSSPCCDDGIGIHYDISNKLANTYIVHGLGDPDTIVLPSPSDYIGMEICFYKVAPGTRVPTRTNITTSGNKIIPPDTLFSAVNSFTLSSTYTVVKSMIQRNTAFWFVIKG